MGFDANFEKFIISMQAGSSLINSKQAGSSLNVPRQAGSRDPASNGTSHDAADNAMPQISIFNDAAYVSRITEYRRRCISKYNFHPPFPKFKWQSSFHDHIIRDRKDFVHHLAYIRRQWLKHKLLENKYCFINQALCAEAL
jgi:hypothetical protein